VIASFRTMNKVAPFQSTLPEISTGCLLSAMFVDVIRASIHDRDSWDMVPDIPVVPIAPFFS